MPTDSSFEQAATESLPDLSLRLVNQVKEARRGGDPATILATAVAAAEMIEERAGECLNDEQRSALAAAQRFTYNAAADCWPGWSLTAPAVDELTLERARETSRRSAQLVERLGLGRVQRGTAAWLCGAFELALGRFADAATLFTVSQQHFTAAEAPGPALLSAGYIAIVAQLAPGPRTGGVNLEEICARIAAGGFQEGAAWIEQLRTAFQVFTMSQRGTDGRR
jgi:hypothetical protein